MTHAWSLLAVTWIASLWQGIALAMLAAAGLRLMPRAGASLRHVVLVTVFALAMALPLLPVHSSARTEPHAGLTIAPWIAAAIALLWVVASAVRAASLAHAWLHLRRVRAAATPVAVDAIPAGSRSAVLCSSSDVDTPAVLGFFRPVLLLPTWLVPTLSPDELHDIALHECEHLRRRDDWVNLFLQVGLVLMPLNPALLWLSSRIASERELACDAAVVAATSQPLAYAASLTRLAERRLKQHGMRLALAALGRESELSQRVYALLRQPSARWSRRQSVVAMGATAIVLFAAATCIAHAPRLVSVTERVRVAEPLPAAVSHAVAEPPATPTAMKLLPVSYSVRPLHKHERKAIHRLPRVSTAAPPAQRSIRFLQAATSASEVPLTDAMQYDDRPAHRVTVDFIPNYVAVPVANGWLLIEL